MKISIIGGGNMGGAIARGLSTGLLFKAQDITVITKTSASATRMKDSGAGLNVVASEYDSLDTADIVIVAVKVLAGIVTVPVSVV